MKRTFSNIVLKFSFLAIFTIVPCFSIQDDLVLIRKELEEKNSTPSDKKSLEILNVSYDPTREFYEAYNHAFKTWWKDKTQQIVTIIQSHGGSAKQARAVISGLEADVVSLALAFDIDAIESMTHLVGSKEWENRLPHKSAPYFSTIVFLVRTGNPKGIKDWGDLIKEGINVVMPNPKTSGGARWTYMAAWGWALNQYKSQDGAKDYLKKLFKNAPILETGARGATTTFIQRDMGDVLLTWENEAYLTIEKEGKGAFEIVYPSLSIQADPPVTWLEGILKEKGTADAAHFYLKYLYSVQAQELIAQHFFRPYDETILEKNKARFPPITMQTIKDFGGWEKVQELHFKDDALFDQVYLNEA
mgnify:CR=1 FL=1